jgi:hypothetical protein
MEATAAATAAAAGTTGTAIKALRRIGQPFCRTRGLRRRNVSFAHTRYTCPRCTPRAHTPKSNTTPQQQQPCIVSPSPPLSILEKNGSLAPSLFPARLLRSLIFYSISSRLVSSVFLTRRWLGGGLAVPSADKPTTPSHNTHTLPRSVLSLSKSAAVFQPQDKDFLLQVLRFVCVSKWIRDYENRPPLIS